MSVKLLMEQEATAGNAVALGLSLHLRKPTFIATLLILSDVLTVLSRCCQSNTLNLLSVLGTANLNLMSLKTILYKEATPEI